jgi:hypothetical protein
VIGSNSDVCYVVCACFASREGNGVRPYYQAFVITYSLRCMVASHASVLPHVIAWPDPVLSLV